MSLRQRTDGFFIDHSIFKILRSSRYLCLYKCYTCFIFIVLSLLQDLCEGQNSVPRNAISEVRGGVAWWRWRKLLPVGRSTWQLFLRVAEISSSSFTMFVYFFVVSISKKIKSFWRTCLFLLIKQINYSKNERSSH